MNKKRLLVAISCFVALVCTITNIQLNNQRTDFSISSLFPEALANGEDGESGGKKYDLNAQDCTITETRPCTIEIAIFNWECKISFEYTVDVAGTADPCRYTGNEDHYCKPYICKKNG